MPQSSIVISDQPWRRASAYGINEKRAVVALLTPYVLRFDGWHREAAYMSERALAGVDQPSERQNLRSRAAELMREVEASYESFLGDTKDYANASRVGDLTHSFRQLLSSLRAHGAA